MNFIADTNYGQIDLTDPCDSSGNCAANPVYSADGVNDNWLAVTYCENECLSQDGCEGLFYQQQWNGHEICGFYSGINVGNMGDLYRWDDHQAGALCMNIEASYAMNLNNDNPNDTDYDNGSQKKTRKH